MHKARARTHTNTNDGPTETTLAVLVLGDVTREAGVLGTAIGVANHYGFRDAVLGSYAARLQVIVPNKGI